MGQTNGQVFWSKQDKSKSANRKQNIQTRQITKEDLASLQIQCSNETLKSNSETLACLLGGVCVCKLVALVEIVGRLTGGHVVRS